MNSECTGRNRRGGRFPTRRDVLGIAATAGAVGILGRTWPESVRAENGMRSSAFIGKADRYDQTLRTVILDGLRELGVKPAEVRGKRILLKPNLVETADGARHINTHPSVVVAAAEAFRSLGAATVIVAEGQGHRRDSWLVLEESGMGRAMDENGLEFVDLNHDDFRAVANSGHRNGMSQLHLPLTVLESDWIVSVAKLKTHHWTGMTCCMKNLFGIMPGIVYGWPKNPLHQGGIHESILDINQVVQPQLCIVDAIECMEGDGPVMGSPKNLGALVLGRNATSVDATCARLMSFDPARIGYLLGASGLLGPISSSRIEQRGASIESLRTRFELLDVRHLRSITVS